MVDLVPMGAIPEEEFYKTYPEVVPEGAIPEEEFNKAQGIHSEPSQYESATEMAKTAIEQGISGATLGASKVLETQGIPLLGIPAITTPEAIAGREKDNPITATSFNLLGTALPLVATGGLGALAKGAGVGARIGLSALEGAGISGVNQFNDDWSQNKSLDAQKIAASVGLGALLGGAGGVLGETINAFKAAKSADALAKVSSSTADQAGEAASKIASAESAPFDAPKEYKGVQPTTYQGIVDRVNAAKASNTAQELPSAAILDDSLSRVALENPVNPLQRDSLASQETRDIYQAAKEAPNGTGPILQNYEAAQKAELVGKTFQTLKEIAPEHEPIPDAYKAGKFAIDAFTNQYETEKKALSPIFENLKKLPVEKELLPDSIIRMTEAVPGIANMVDATGSELAIRPYKTAWGIDKATYNAVKEAIDGLTGEENNLQTLWNVRKGLDQHVDVLAQGQAPSQIRSLKSALMNQMQEATGNPNIRDAFKRYAINEQQREVIEKAFGASVGKQEFGQISKIKPEVIGDKIFNNSATVQAAKNILPKEQFNAMLSNWLSEAQAGVTDKGAFSANKFGSFLRRNQDALNIAFQDNPAHLQKLNDLTTIMRILPDAPSVNPSGTAKTLFRMMQETNIHNLTWEGLLATIPKKIATEIDNTLTMRKLNTVLSGQALKNSQESALKSHIAKFSDRLDTMVKTLFSSSTSQTRKKEDGR